MIVRSYASSSAHRAARSRRARRPNIDAGRPAASATLRNARRFCAPSPSTTSAGGRSIRRRWWTRRTAKSSSSFGARYRPAGSVAARGATPLGQSDDRGAGRRTRHPGVQPVLRGDGRGPRFSTRWRAWRDEHAARASLSKEAVPRNVFLCPRRRSDSLTFCTGWLEPQTIDGHEIKLVGPNDVGIRPDPFGGAASRSTSPPARCRIARSPRRPKRPSSSGGPVITLKRHGARTRRPGGPRGGGRLLTPSQVRGTIAAASVIRGTRWTRTE